MTEDKEPGTHLGQKFSTRDQDNDNDKRASCAVIFSGAWWYNRCLASNLNGAYQRFPDTPHAYGIIWRSWKGYSYSLKFTEMKIRPFN